MPQIQCSLSDISTHLTFFTSYFLSNWTPVFCSKVKIMPHCHPLVCIRLNHELLSFSLSLLLFFYLFNYLPHIPFWQMFCLSCSPPVTHLPQPCCPVPLPRPQPATWELPVPPESARGEEKRFVYLMQLPHDSAHCWVILCGKFVMSWLIMIRIQYRSKVWGR